MRIDSDTNIDGTTTTTGTFTVIALASQFDSTAPFDSGYQILPRSLADIVVTGAPTLTVAPSPLAFGSVTLGGSAIASATLANVGLSPITLVTPFTITDAAASQYSVGLPGTTSLAAGASTTVSVTFSPTLTGAQSATLHVSDTAGDNAAATLSGTGAAVGGGATGVVISEFRSRGPSGGNDEFVEIYNSTSTAVDISGWKMKGSNSAGTNSTRATVPASVSLPAHAHYLFTNTAASGYSGGVAGNTTYTTGITDDGGIAITLPNDTIVDAVGSSVGSAFKEGTVLTPLTTNLNQGYERKPGGANGSTQDTGNNAADFALKGPSDPQNLSSAITPPIVATPASLNFGSMPAGAAVSVPVTVQNISASVVTLTPPFVVTGANAADFAAGTPGTTTLAPGASTTVSVSFHPMTAGAKAAGVAITSATGGTTVGLNGIATAGISVSPASYDFGSVDIGASAATSITITNDDAAPATLTPPFAITGMNASEFGVGVPGVTALAGGESTSVAVGFHSTSAGGKSATLSITSAAGSVRTVSLIGSSACPTIVVGGSLPAGIIGSPYMQTLVASGGAPPYAFIVSLGMAPTGVALSVGGTVSGIPTVASPFTFTVQATDAVGCVGSAQFTMPVLSATINALPSPLDFGEVNIGSPVSQNVTITNTSGFAVTLSTPFTITGTDAAQFSVALPATATLSAGGATTVGVTFGPTTFGGKTATLNVTSSAGGAATATLSGQALNTSVGHTILISEFRFRGPAGASDEFVEIYNSGAVAIERRDRHDARDGWRRRVDSWIRSLPVRQWRGQPGRRGACGSDLWHGLYR